MHRIAMVLNHVSLNGLTLPSFPIAGFLRVEFLLRALDARLTVVFDVVFLRGAMTQNRNFKRRLE